ncbi:hypothetical protein MLD38_040709 [Melastoma candidum]|nr:hypothetical protein MLD38_040709 [Melastoma candidum]
MPIASGRYAHFSRSRLDRGSLFDATASSSTLHIEDVRTEETLHQLSMDITDPWQAEERGSHEKFLAANNVKHAARRIEAEVAPPAEVLVAGDGAGRVGHLQAEDGTYFRVWRTRT